MRCDPRQILRDLTRRAVGPVTACALACGVTAVAHGDDPPAPATRPAVQAKVDALVAPLSSPDWRARERAAAALVRLGDDALPALRRLAGRSADPEVRARAAAAAARIEELRQVGPTPVTVRWANVPVAQAIADLARQAHAPVTDLTPAASAAPAAAPPTLPTEPPALLQKSDKRVSLSADRRPFWEVMESVCRQAGLAPVTVNRHGRDLGLGLVRDDADWSDKPIVRSGPLLIRADRLQFERAVQLKAPNDATRELSISLTVFAEPKLKVLDYSGTVRLDEVVDAQGRSLLPPEDDAVAANVEVFGNARGGGGNTSHWDVGASLHYPKGIKGINRIARFRGTTTLVVQTRAGSLDLPTTGVRNLARQVEGLRVLVKAADTARADLSVFRDGRGDGEWNAVREQLYAAEARLYDDKGQLVGRGQTAPEVEDGPDNQRLDVKLRFSRDGADAPDQPRRRRGGRGGGSGGDAGPDAAGVKDAVRIVWEFPAEARPLVVPFEFKDLPIP